MHLIEWPQTNSVELAKRLRVLPGFVWLDSSDASHVEGRYSFLSALPTEIVKVASCGAHEQVLCALSEIQNSNCESTQHAQLPHDLEIPRWIGWIAYDALNPSQKRDAQSSDALWFGNYPAVVCVDHKSSRALIIGDDERACAPLIAALDRSPAPANAPRIELLEIDPAEQHVASIKQALELIAAGEIYQVNLARRWHSRCTGDPFALWLAMRESSPVPLGAYLQSAETTILASTMERFLNWDREERRLYCAPIKGTAARSQKDGDTLLAQNPKELAEHTMIVDLIRNDLGRVAEPGTVRLEKSFRVEPFANLSHLISTVCCRTRSEINLRDILRATFPPGSVTGAPKIRAQQVIEELEAHAREIYCGAIGFVGRNGGLSLSVAIRTAVLHNDTIDYWAGGGIVEASVPEAEVAETELKAHAYLRAIDSLKSAH